MLSINNLVVVTCIPIVCWTLLRTYKLIVNYFTARKLGFPIIVVPVYRDDWWWLVTFARFNWIRHIPAVGYWLPRRGHAWTLQDRYLPHRKHGDAFTIVSPTRVEVIINDPAVGVEVQSHYKAWQKPGSRYEVFDLFGTNVLSVNGEDWQRHRKIINPAFREQNYKLVWAESIKQAGQMLDTIGRQLDMSITLLDVRNHCVIIAMHVLSAAGFGHAHDFDGGFRGVSAGHTRSLADTLMYLLSNLLWTVLYMKYNWLGYGNPTRYNEVMGVSNEFRQYMKEIVAYHRATTQAGGGGQSADIVSALVEADEAAKREEKASSLRPMHLTDQELLGNLFVFNLAGFETTANALTYTIPLLAANTAVQDWVGEEVDAVYKDGEQPDYEDAFPSSVRVQALMYETLRLWGPITDAPRWTSSEAQILRIQGREVLIPPNTYVTTNFSGIHSDPRWWGSDSLTWRPQRWIELDLTTGKKSIAAPPDGAAYMAWSIGPRVCPGHKFSQVESSLSFR
ncbi:cytochrome P450 [Exophiala viscosa]|uniref:Cytochrome P450 n=1 Tax=Exophiala viscosa TaxID=2486360 RepID=A0AAN6IDW6_9EURO|nr:cytochrome P450 [Exophiala viscosa]